MTILYRDYETRSSTLDVSDVGAWRYATHPETEIQCCAFAVDDEPVKLWVPGDPVPTRVYRSRAEPRLARQRGNRFIRAIDRTTHNECTLRLATHSDRKASRPRLLRRCEDAR